MIIKQKTLSSGFEVSVWVIRKYTFAATSNILTVELAGYKDADTYNADIMSIATRSTVALPVSQEILNSGITLSWIENQIALTEGWEDAVIQ